MPCRKLNHQNFTPSLVSLFALSNPMWLIPKLVSLHLHPYRWESPIPSSVLACTTRTKEERWDWVEQMWEAGAYLWLTNWSVKSSVSVGVVSDLAFSIDVLPLGVTVFSFTLRESQSSVIQKSMVITVCEL